MSLIFSFFSNFYTQRYDTNKVIFVLFECLNPSAAYICVLLFYNEQQQSGRRGTPYRATIQSWHLPCKGQMVCRFPEAYSSHGNEEPSIVDRFSRIFHHIHIVDTERFSYSAASPSQRFASQPPTLERTSVLQSSTTAPQSTDDTTLSVCRVFGNRRDQSSSLSPDSPSTSWN